MSGATYDSNPSQAKKQKTDDFDEWVITNSDIIPGNKSEIEMYLDEGVYKPGNEEYEDFDALNWWKDNSLKFRHLSKMARDILSIPITTVASESAFCAGGRVLDQYRSSLKPETIQALICMGDWLRQDFGVELASNVSTFY